MKLLAESARNDLILSMANTTTFPGYGYFLAQGYTTWHVVRSLAFLLLVVLLLLVPSARAT